MSNNTFQQVTATYVDDESEAGDVTIFQLNYTSDTVNKTFYLYNGIIHDLNGRISGDGEAIGSIYIYIKYQSGTVYGGYEANIKYGTSTLYSIIRPYVQGPKYEDNVNFSDYSDLIGKYLVFSDTEYIAITADMVLHLLASDWYNQARAWFRYTSLHTVTINSDKIETISSSPSNTHGPETEYIQDEYSFGIVNTFPSPINTESLCRIANGKFTGTGSDVVIPVFTSFGILLYWTETESTVNIVNLNTAPREITSGGVTTRVSATAGKVYHWIQILSL